LVSEVTVFLSIEKFDVDTFLSCLYVFMHECVCHVFQGLTTAELRPTTEPTDRFAEGWMDFIAAGLLGKSFGNAAAQLSVANFEQERVGADYHSSRLNYLHPDRVKYAVQWAHGRQAAQKILHLFAGLPETCNMVNEAFLKLSFDLNLCPLESRTRELLIAQIDKYLPLKGEKFGTRYPDFVAIVRKYLINNDINSFVPDVIAFG
ncbi:MAG TPA: hypothetical protein VFA74_16090, partial [Terriglobales bacterium]|nr:hypothetical protein [Terriglobales bacterium]